LYFYNQQISMILLFYFLKLYNFDKLLVLEEVLDISVILLIVDLLF